MEICYLIGDATEPIYRPAIIVHICNNVGAWGAGFVLALSKKWKKPEIEYKKWYAQNNSLTLGDVQFVAVEQGICIANMIGQEGIGFHKGKPPIRYDAVSKCLQTVRETSLLLSASVHMPRIGCGLAGGTWSEIGKIIHRELIAFNVPVIVYDLK